MALLKFISLSVGSLMLLQGAYAQAKNSVAEATGCLTTINKARADAGLTNFGDVTENNKHLSGANEANTLTSICKTLQTDNVASDEAGLATPLGGTVAYLVQETPDCSAAVDKWKAGFSKFSSYTSSLPPAYKNTKKDTQLADAAPYDSLDAINFVTLYSAANGATAECGYVTCQDKTPSTPKEVKATVCITYPPALVNEQQPYNDAQWKGILKVFAPSNASSASAAVPTLLALAATAVGVALM